MKVPKKHSHSVLEVAEKNRFIPPNYREMMNRFSVRYSHGECTHRFERADVIHVIAKRSSFNEKIAHLDHAYSAIREVFLAFPHGEFIVCHKTKVRRDFCQLFIRLLDLCMTDRLEIVLKEELTMLFARCFRNDLDQGVTYPLTLFSGRVKRYLKRCAARAARGSKKYMIFIRSLVETKRCWIKLSRRLELVARVKHARTLGRKPKPPSPEALERIRQTIRLLPDPDQPEFRPPTFGAAINAPRKNGGCHGWHCDENPLSSALGVSPYSNYRKIYSMARERARNNLPGNVKTEGRLIDQINQVVYHMKTNYPREVHYHAIFEPGKIRPITMGCPDEYTLFRPLQGSLLRLWKKVRCGTMRPDFPEYLTWRMSSAYADLLFELTAHDDRDLFSMMDYVSSAEHFSSGDYSQATDLLNPEATRVALGELVSKLKLPFTDRFLALDSFSNNWIRYPGKEVYNELKDDPEIEVIYEPQYKSSRVKQRNGQLMGHPLSFPLLCIINLSTLYGITFDNPTSLAYAPMAINGDDILFRGTPSMIAKWEQNAKDVGLKMNPLKTFRSKEWSLINSILTHRDGEQVPFYNRALCIGHNVKSTPQRLLGQAAVLWQEINHPLLPLDARRLGSRPFLKQLEEKLKGLKLRFHQRPFVPNFFLPKCFGGLGMENRTGYRYKITRDQRIFATYLLRHPGSAWLFERFCGESLICTRKALNAFLKTSPSLIPLKPCDPDFIGPLEQIDDPEPLMESHLIHCLGSYSLEPGGYDKGDEIVSRISLSHAEAWKEKPLKSSSLRSLTPFRYVLYSRERVSRLKSRKYIPPDCDSLYEYSSVNPVCYRPGICRIDGREMNVFFDREGEFCQIGSLTLDVEWDDRGATASYRG